MKVLKNTLAFFILAGLTVACNDTTNTKEIDKGDTQEIETVKSEINQDVESVDTNPTEIESTYPNYSDIPTDRYIDVFSKNFSYLRPIALANNTMEFTTDEKLAEIFPEYHSEADLFKKQDLAKELTPKLEAAINKYKSPIGIKVPLGEIRDSNHPYQKVMKSLNAEVNEKINFSPLASIRILDYNFDTKSFPIQDCNYGRSFKMLNGNQNNIEAPDGFVIKAAYKAPSTGFIGEKLPDEEVLATSECGLLVEDRDLAQKIQSLSFLDLGVSGWAYYAVNKADYRTIYVDPVRADVILFNEKNGEELLKTQLNW